MGWIYLSCDAPPTHLVTKMMYHKITFFSSISDTVSPYYTILSIHTANYRTNRSVLTV